jgi:hypothetical protein
MQEVPVDWAQVAFDSRSLDHSGNRQGTRSGLEGFIQTAGRVH